MIEAPLALLHVHHAFKAAGHDMWFVGGCVRDTLLGTNPKDIDLCTTATPDEAIQIYRLLGVRHIETGLDHGTITIVLDNVHYEITSLRTESQHDGRRAVVAYTRDLNEDLSRRDLTINSMAQTMDGQIIDPFGGQEDLDNNRIRFVGDAEERMKEDYLRILRFFRFHGRFGRGTPLDEVATEAIQQTRNGLSQISGERIWLEMSKIIVGPQSTYILQRMKQLGVTKVIGLPNINMFAAADTWMKKLTRPSIVLGLISSSTLEQLEETMERWKLAKSERAEARYAFESKTKYKLRDYKHDLVDGANIDHVEEMLKYHLLPSLRKWDVPVFPVTGADLIEMGYEPGPTLGAKLRNLRDMWRESKYTLKKKDLLV